ncbi:MAG: hydroxymethylbilane synthase [Cycloclasticus sp. symbiont of Poecilosclerida sp. M]|nr:MAG: hydroxymethylbilane synthase [Cycloclasticus sp. symbiont of Poecilosclerida sp. M]
MTLIRIATRRSPLALWQAEHVAERLQKAHPDVSVELVKMTTTGDKILDTPLAKIGGKGLFVKELEHALLNGTADLAVHSMKDVPAKLPEGLSIEAILNREDPRDAFVSNKHDSIEDLPKNATIGTSSLRRQCQLLEQRPDLNIKPLRGNVNTRLKKLDDEEYDAIILASAGLIRLNFNERIKISIPVRQSIPAIGQGAIGIECRFNDDDTQQLIACLHDATTTQRVTAERAMNLTLEGGCQAPIAGHAKIKNNVLGLTGLVAEPDGTLVLREYLEGSVEDAQKIGVTVAERLLKKGAKEILGKLYGSHDV